MTVFNIKNHKSFGTEHAAKAVTIPEGKTSVVMLPKLGIERTRPSNEIDVEVLKM